jgi:hypothetical protein
MGNGCSRPQGAAGRFGFIFGFNRLTCALVVGFPRPAVSEDLDGDVALPLGADLQRQDLAEQHHERRRVLLRLPVEVVHEAVRAAATGDLGRPQGRLLEQRGGFVQLAQAIRLATSGQCSGPSMPPRSTLAFIRLQVRVIIVCKFLDTDEETVRCSFAGSNQFVDLPLVFYM